MGRRFITQLFKLILETEVLVNNDSSVQTMWQSSTRMKLILFLPVTLTVIYMKVNKIH